MDERKIIPFIDLCLNTLFVFIVLFVMSPKQKQTEASAPTAGEYMIVVTWSDKSEDDVDTYVLDPKGYLVYFRRREDGLMHLERDDLGERNDVIQNENGESYLFEKNEERVIIRGIIPGEYVVNVHMYLKRTLNDPTRVQIALMKLQGQDEEITKKEVVLKDSGDEETAFRFTLAADGRVANISTLKRSLTKRVGEKGGN